MKYGAQPIDDRQVIPQVDWSARVWRYIPVSGAIAARAFIQPMFASADTEPVPERRGGSDSDPPCQIRKDAS